MKKQILALVMILAFTVASAGVGFAAKAVKCKVTGVDGSTVTLDCGDRAGKVKVGDKVNVKKARKALEGC